MSTTPPPHEENPDTRPLPEGWITQFDSNRKAWCYVNTKASPPVTTWIFPSGPPSPSPQPQYALPQTYGGEYNQGGGYKDGEHDYDIDNNHGGYGEKSGGNNSYPQLPQYGGYNNPQNNSYYNNGGDGSGYGLINRSYGQATHNSDGKGMGGLQGGLLGGKLGSKPSGGGGVLRGFGGARGGSFGVRGRGRACYPQTVNQQGRTPKKSGGMGMGGMIVSLGLLAGPPITDAFDDDFGGGDFGDFGDF